MKSFAAKATIQQYFRRDAVAGLTLAIISIPLGMAFAIASGVSPAQGLYTAVVAGFFIALLGGCRYQIGGPTGAFVVIIFNTLQQYGYAGLTMTMLIAGIVMIAAGYLRLGTYIKYIPYPVVVGFTSGIAVLLFSTQVKDMLGLDIASVPAEFRPNGASILKTSESLAGRPFLSPFCLSASFFMSSSAVRSCRHFCSALSVRR